MAIRQTPQADQFKQQLRDSLQRETLNSRTIKIARHANVYTAGDQDEAVYFIESGQIKLLTHSAEGRECLLAIHSAGDIFGELCLAGFDPRLSTATARLDQKIVFSSSKKTHSPMIWLRSPKNTLPSSRHFHSNFVHY